MFSAQILVQRNSKCIVSALSCRKSWVLVRNGEASYHRLRQTRQVAKHIHPQSWKCMEAESWSGASLSISYYSRRCFDVVAKELRELLPQKIAFEIQSRAFCSMDALYSAGPAEGFARHLWEGSQKQAFLALYHPFVVALACGTLHLCAYRTYIAQDVYFLQAFAEAYGLAIEHTDDVEAKTILQGLKRHVQDELDEVHNSIMQGSSESNLVQAIIPNLATTAYTDFLLGVAKGGPELQNFAVFDAKQESAIGSETLQVLRRKIAAYTLAAMTPCMRLYAYLGQEIKKTLKSSSAFSEWIDAYASADFGSSALQSEYLVQRLAMLFPAEIDKDAMESLYRHAMELEVDFFGAQPLDTNSPILVPLVKSESTSSCHFIFISDFDSTCTVSDSCPALADLSIATAQRDISTKGQVNLAVPCLRSQWDSLNDQYNQEYTLLLDELLSELEQDKSRHYNEELCQHLLEQLAAFEILANGRVADSGVLTGLNMDDVKQSGRSVPLREGCRALLQQLVEGSFLVDLHILSVCWSRCFIEGSLCHGGLPIPNIHSNELQFDTQGISTGNMVRRLQTALDKEKLFTDITGQTKERSSPLSQTCTVYLGDSLTDLLCLLRADIGIVIGNSSTLDRVAKACGITFLSLYTGLLQQQQQHTQGGVCVSPWTKVDGVLYRISSWHELHAFLLGS